MADGLFRAQFDDNKYTDVCKYTREKRGQTNAEEKRGVKEAFAGLECKGDRVNEWEAESSKEVYRKTFKKAKECMQRRISTMKRFPARNLSGKQARIRHIYPIELAYSYGKDCLKKFATKKQQNLYRNSTNALIDEVSANNNTKNIKSYFNPTIENSIRAKRSNAAEILDKQYDYSPNNWNLINTVRTAGDEWASLSNEQRTMYLSRFYNTLMNRPNVLEAVNNSANENNAAAPVETPKIRLRKLKRRTKRVTAPSRPPPEINTLFLNALQRDPNFQRRTAEEKVAFIESTKNRLITMQRNLEIMMLKRDTLDKLINSAGAVTEYDKTIIGRGKAGLTREQRQQQTALEELKAVVAKALAESDSLHRKILRDYDILQSEIARYPELGQLFKVDIFNYTLYDLNKYISRLPDSEYYPLFAQASDTMQKIEDIDAMTKLINDSPAPKRRNIILGVLEREKISLQGAKTMNEKTVIKDKIKRYEAQLDALEPDLYGLLIPYKNRTELFKTVINNMAAFDNPILLRDYEAKRYNDALAKVEAMIALFAGLAPPPGEI